MALFTTSSSSFVRKMSSQDLRHWSHDFFCEFIDLYRNHPCLWQIKSKGYSDRNKKALAYEALINKCKEVEPNANKDFVAKKINSFRTVYRKECAKIKSSMRSGAGSDEVYKPTLWYFDLLNFLGDADQELRNSVSNLDESDDEVEDEAATLDNVEKGSAHSNSTTPKDGKSSTASGNATSSSFGLSTGRPSGKRKKPHSPTKEILALAGEKLKAMNAEDEFQVFGKYVAHKLRALKGNQQIFARKLISDVIYEGELESLTKDFKVMNCSGSVPFQNNQSAMPTQNYYYNDRANAQFGTYGFPQSYSAPRMPVQRNNANCNAIDDNTSETQSQSVISNFISTYDPNN